MQFSDESSKVDEAVPNTTTASDSKRRKKKKHKKVRSQSKDRRQMQIHPGGNWKDFDNYTSTVLEFVCVGSRAARTRSEGGGIFGFSSNASGQYQYEQVAFCASCSSLKISVVYFVL